jgi:hypothetical protein
VAEAGGIFRRQEFGQRRKMFLPTATLRLSVNVAIETSGGQISIRAGVLVLSQMFLGDGRLFVGLQIAGVTYAAQICVT